MISFKLFVLVLAVLATSAKLVELIEPKAVHVNDKPESVKLAISEKITANLMGALSYSIEYIPQHSGECKIKSVRDHFRQLAARNLNPGYYSMVTSLVNLKEHNLTVLIDVNLYVAAFEIKNGRFEDRTVNQTLRNPNGENLHDTPLLVLDENETYILAVTPLAYYVINISELKSGRLTFKQVQQSLGESIVRMEIFNGVLFVATREAGVKAFKVNPDFASVELIYTISDPNLMCEDFAIEKKSKILYVLDFQRGIEVYNISSTHQKPAKYDFIDLSSHTRKNQKIEIQNQIIVIAFFHRSENVVAEFNYKVDQKKYSFMRYFKFKDILIDIHLMDEHLIAIGDVFVAVFPVNIHPKLIQTEMNGNIVLSPIRKVVQLKGPYFIGLTNDNLILGEVQVENSDVISCELKDNAKLKKLIYRANTTSCGSKREYFDYCTYTKQVQFEIMNVVASEETARGLWIAILILCGAIVFGVLFLYLLKKKKSRTIEFLEAEFEKKKTMVPLPSQRLSTRVGAESENHMAGIPPAPLEEEQTAE